MASIYRELVVRADCATVFDYLSRPANIVAYSAAISECKVSQWPIGPGTVYKQRLQFVGLDMPLRWKIARFEPPHLTVLEGNISTGPARLEFRISPLDGNRARLEHTMYYHPPTGILAIARRIIQGLLEQQLDKDMARLKRLIEAHARAANVV